MIIDEAINIIEKERAHYKNLGWLSEYDAFGLGIEALKREKRWRENPRWGIPPLMEGEIEEQKGGSDARTKSKS